MHPFLGLSKLVEASLVEFLSSGTGLLNLQMEVWGLALASPASQLEHPLFEKVEYRKEAQEPSSCQACSCIVRIQAAVYHTFSIPQLPTLVAAELQEALASPPSLLCLPRACPSQPRCTMHFGAIAPRQPSVAGAILVRSSALVTLTRALSHVLSFQVFGFLARTKDFCFGIWAADFDFVVAISS